ncbi:hypothetical protein HDU79_006445 [Rhizoclosmatium sp. JEL0117]|nr:hypothetical protein HDU79_006445 [Rhizoclosmatium sp. JEL0117]
MADASADDAAAADIIKSMEFKRKWQALVARIKAAEAQPLSSSKWPAVMANLRSTNFKLAAESLAELAAEGDTDALWVLSYDPTDSPVSDPYFRYHAGVSIRTVLGVHDSALLWFKMAVEGGVVEACLQIAEICWASSSKVNNVERDEDYAMALEYLLKAVALLDLKSGSPSTICRAEVCIKISECYGYGVGTLVDDSKAVEWLERAWSGNPSSRGILTSLIKETKNEGQKTAAKLLSVWYSTGTPPVEPLFIGRNLVPKDSQRQHSFQQDFLKAQLWGKRSI